MMKHETIRLTLVAAVSFALAWFIKSGMPLPQHTNPAAVDSHDSRTSKNRAAKKSSAPATARLLGYLDKITRVESGNESQLQEVMNDISISDIPALLAEWQKRAGFFGVDSTEKALMQKLIAQWYEQDANGALAWIAAIEPKADRDMMLTGVLLVEAGRDWDRALAIAEQFGSREERGFDMPDELASKMRECDAALVMKILRTFPRKSFMSGGDLQFKDNFDFATMGKMIAEDLVADEKAGYSYSISNFLREWAKKDSQAAWDWFVDSPKAPMFGSVGDLFPALSKKLGIENANRALVAQVNEIDDVSEKYSYAFQALGPINDSHQIADFVAQMPGQRMEHWQALVEHSKITFGYQYVDYNFTVIQAMTPEERMFVLHKTYATSSAHNIENAARTLHKLGHSQAEIDAMLPPKPEEN